MRCSCQNCGTYMVQDEKGFQSRCICPECFTVCTACMGTAGKPLSIDQIKIEAMRRDSGVNEDYFDK